MSGFLTEAIATAARYGVGGTPQSAFTVPFPFDAATDLVVLVDEVATSAFTVSGATQDGFYLAGATLTLTTPIENVDLSVERQTEVEQQSLFPISGAFQVKALNGEFSRVWMALQDLERQIRDRVGVVAGEAPMVNLPQRSVRANKLLGFDADGEPTLLDAFEEGSIANDIITNTVFSIVARIFPSGIIVKWSGSVATIPEGYALCDGNNGTPDLRGLMILGAGGAFNPNTTGGSLLTALGGAATFNSAGTAITVAQMPVHAHGGATAETTDVHTHKVSGTPGSGNSIANSWAPGNTNNYILQNGEPDGWDSGPANNPHFHVVSSEGGGEPHSHPVTVPDHQHVQDRPPYYALAFIMRVNFVVPPPTENDPVDLSAAALRFVQPMACGDETSAIDETGQVLELEWPASMMLKAGSAGLRINVSGACATGTLTVDVRVGGTTILSTPLTIDATEKTSRTAVVPVVISSSTIVEFSTVTVWVTDVGDGTAFGLKATFDGTLVD